MAKHRVMSEDMYQRTRRVVLNAEDTPHRAELTDYDFPPIISPTATAYNCASKAVPPYCVAKIVGAYTQGDGVTQVIAIDKPTAEVARDYLINGPKHIYTLAERNKDPRNSCYGQCYTHGTCLARYGGETPAIGDVLGPSADSWVLSKTGSPALVSVLGIIDSTNKIARVRYLAAGDNRAIELKTSLAPEGTATGWAVSFNEDDHDYDEPTYTDDPITVYNKNGSFRCLGHDDVASGQRGAIVIVDSRNVVVSALIQQAKRIRGTLGGALTETTASQTISNPVATDGGQLPTGTITGYNRYTTKGFAGPSGGVCRAEWDEAAGRYEWYDVECE